MTTPEVINNKAESRYELSVDGAVAIAAYRVENGAIVFTHTVVPEELEGRGIGSRLVAGALADAEQHGRKIVPLCTFVRHYVERHPRTQALLA
jgi:uncharacterized protein